jgi:mono/diheme cytochrome c family protein
MHHHASLVALAALAMTSVPAHADRLLLSDANGQQLYAELCASCHGPAARGDGPVADSLKVRPPDLTTIGARHGGAFPAEQVRDMIDGRAAVPAHGTREMPVWGYEFEARAPETEPGRATATTATNRLVEFLRSIQE